MPTSVKHTSPCKYALNQNGELVHIDTVPLSYRERGVFSSYVDGAPMIAKKGKKNIWHFAHKDNAEREGESDIHKLGKIAFKQEFDKPGPFYITIKTPLHCALKEKCELGDRTFCNREDNMSFDLKTRYVSCELEKWIIQGDNQFRADVCLIPREQSKKPLLIEIYHTSESTPQKQESGLPMIEITFQTEEDVKLFQNRIFSESSNVRFFGIRPIRSYPTEDVFKAPTLIARINQNGEININKSTCFELSKYRHWIQPNDCLTIVTTENTDMPMADYYRCVVQIAALNGVYAKGADADRQTNVLHKVHLPVFELKDYYIAKGPNADAFERIRLYASRDGGINLLEQEWASVAYSPEQKGYARYLESVVQCYYQGTYDVSVELLSMTAEQAYHSGRYVALIPKASFEASINNPLFLEDHKYVPVIVDEIPPTLVLDGDTANEYTQHIL